MSDPTSDRYEEFTRMFLRGERELLRHILCVIPHLADANDVLQETAIALWKKFKDFDSSQPFLPWAKGFATLEAKRHLRDASRNGRLNDELVERLLARRDSMLEELNRQQEHLRECLAKLNDNQREVILAYYFQQASVEGIAAESGGSVASVYKSLQRIRATLLECVRRAIRSEGRES